MNIVNLKPEESGFEDFWKVCAIKKLKALCKIKYDAITGDGLKTRMLDRDSGTYVELELTGTHEELKSGMIKYNEQQTDPVTYKLKEYTCMTSTWLNQGRWMDSA